MSRLGATETKLLNARKASGTLVAALIDPENFTVQRAVEVAKKVQELGAGCIFIGGSTIADQGHLEEVVNRIKRDVTLPVLLFPGNITGISRHADAILFSSLLNSTNTYFLIGAQSIGSIQVMRSKLEAIPMGYLVFGDQSTTGFVGQVRSIPLDKPAIAVMYAMAAWYLGMRTLYLEAGSGSEKAISPEVIKAVRACYPGFLIVGGGVTRPESASAAASAGADLVVIGNLLQARGYEKKLALIIEAIKTPAAGIGSG